MKLFALIAAMALLIALASANTVAAEYYVVKSRSGIVRIVDHKPKGGATIVKGPFTTRDEADNALKSAKEPKSVPANQ